MKDIYQKAQRVIVWLGYTNAENASEVFSYLRVGEAYMYDHKNSIARLDRLVRDRRINSLFSSQWFNRLWIVQELYQSARASCFWGDVQIDFTYITAAHMRYNECPQWLDLCTRRSGLPLPLVKLLHLTQHLQCSDNRDRVYAFLALIHKSGYQIKPDFTKSAEQVYRAAALADAADWDIAQDGSPSLYNWFPFTLLGVDHPYGWDPLTSKASSWLPEWGEKLPVPIFQNIGPKFVAMPTAFFSERNLQSVVVEGCMFDNIDFVTESDIPCTKLVDTLQYVSAFWNDHVELWRMLFPFDRDVLNYRFLGALCCAEIDWAELQKHGQKRKKGDDVERKLVHVWKGADTSNLSLAVATGIQGMMSSLLDSEKRLPGSVWSGLPERSIPIYDELSTKWRTRRLFTTCKQYIGLGPGASRAGDVIVNIAGARLPAVLRPHDNYWFFVGYCYISGDHRTSLTNPGYGRSTSSSYDIR
ncbi:hypothetical protein EKO04_011143 [Ascochyta lentis]|uniref:Heterokaryon incompatibility domain-containing protein n=1 Tax=Ascochyta lentis TaxID=205686 RepID=A0A8H7ITA9_9PLEO|nr:hypothetical protein EKO04_011143 [Ascochyta lentis]